MALGKDKGLSSASLALDRRTLMCVGRTARRVQSGLSDHESSLHRIRKDTVSRGSAVQAPSPDNLKHLAASQSADRPACRLTIHSPSPSQVVERRSGDSIPLRVAVENEPDRQLGPAQVGHAGIDEGVQTSRSEAETDASTFSAWRSSLSVALTSASPSS